MKYGQLALLGLIAGVSFVNAQTWDTSGNGMLNGNYYFREVILGYASGQYASTFGNIVFNGNGAYTISAVQFFCDASSGSCGSSPYQSSGTYSISGSGFGFLSNALLNNVTIGGVGANSVFVGSSTESGVNELFIAAPISGQGTGTLNGSYTLSYETPNLFSQNSIPYDALLQMSPNGSGAIGNVGVSAYATSATPFNSQTIPGVKYFVSNNAFVVTFPNSGNYAVTGQEYLYSTPDGSFVFGGSPQDFDMIAGVRTPSGATTTLSGLYFEAGMDFDDSLGGTDTFYGSFNASNATIVGHQRFQNGGTLATGYVYHDAYPTSFSGTYQDIGRSRQFIVSGGVRIALGIGPYPAMDVAVQAPTPTPATGIYLSPASAVNAASMAPFTSGISSGELITLTGTGLGPTALAVATTVPLPTTLAGVQVMINGRLAPIYEASATQLLVQVPYQTTTATAQIQVSYKGATSNTISVLVNTTTPGVFTTPIGGVNRASARHANGTLVTPANPARIGETVAVYLTGLGDVTPPIVDGGAGSAVTPSTPTSTFSVFIGGLAATPSYLGLAPGLPSLYLMKIPIPVGVATGDAFLEIAGPDSYSSQATISVTSTTPGVNSNGRLSLHRRAKLPH